MPKDRGLTKLTPEKRLEAPLADIPVHGKADDRPMRDRSPPGERLLEGDAMTKERAAKQVKPEEIPQPLVELPPDIPLPGGNVIIQRPGQPPQLGMDRSDKLKTMGGSDMMQFNQVLVTSTLATIHSSPDTVVDRIAAAAAAMAAFKPLDEIDGMIVAQAVALHHGAMECLRKANIPNQHPDVASKLRKDGANLARAMTDMLDALDRKRGKGPQVVRVERVVVHEGGQAIVGNVQPGPVLKGGEG